MNNMTTGLDKCYELWKYWFKSFVRYGKTWQNNPDRYIFPQKKIHQIDLFKLESLNQLNCLGAAELGLKKKDTA